MDSTSNTSSCAPNYSAGQQSVVMDEATAPTDSRCSRVASAVRYILGCGSSTDDSTLLYTKNMHSESVYSSTTKPLNSRSCLIVASEDEPVAHPDKQANQGITVAPMIVRA